MTYLFIYLILGIIMLVISLRRDIPGKGRRITGSIFLIIFWPLVVIILGKDILFYKPSSKIIDPYSELKNELIPYISNKTLNNYEREIINKTINSLQDKLTKFGYFQFFEDSLLKFWDIDLHPKLYFEFEGAKQIFKEPIADDGIRYSIAPPEWHIGFTDEFLKSIKGIDRKLQGRILESLKEISETPLQVKGDTMKPLDNNLKGLWRYRIGDYRLLYKPDKKTKLILLICFSHRKNVYQNRSTENV